MYDCVSVELIDSNRNAEETIVTASRTCYDSGDKSTPESDDRLIRRLIDSGHEAMLEFGWAAFRIKCSRVVSHELVRHRLFSYAMRSQRYVNESTAEVAYPPELDACSNAEYAKGMYDKAMKVAWDTYRSLLASGVQKQVARYCLPNSTLTEVVVGGNLREWRHFCKLRCSPKCQPEMREVATLILKELERLAPRVFADMLEDL